MIDKKGSYKEHQNLIERYVQLIQKEFEGARFFPRHVGKFILTRFISDLLKKKCKLEDWKRYIVAINMVGMADGYILLPLLGTMIHIEVEAKTGQAEQTKDQKRWQNYIESNNGIYILLRDEYTSLNELREKINKLLTK